MPKYKITVEYVSQYQITLEEETAQIAELQAIQRAKEEGKLLSYTPKNWDIKEI